MHEQYGNRKEEVNEGVSQWLWKSLDERKRLWEFTVKRQKRHAFCFQERVFKDSIVWGKNILYFHEPIPERVFRSSTAGHTRKIENDKDVYKGCSFKWTLLALWMYSPIGFFFFFPKRLSTDVNSCHSVSCHSAVFWKQHCSETELYVTPVAFRLCQVTKNSLSFQKKR